MNPYGLVWTFLAGGGGAALVLWGFKRFGGGWIDNRFASQLEALKHQQTSELERWKAEAAREHDRMSKLTQLEFQLLPDDWEDLNNAVAATQKMAAQLKEHADLSHLSDDNLHTFLETQEMPELQRREIKFAAQSDRNAIYGRAIQLRDIEQAQRLCLKAFNSLAKAAIFFDDETALRMRTVLEMAWEAVVDFHVSTQHRVAPQKDVGLGKFRSAGETQRRELESYLRARFYPPQLAD